MVYTVSIIGYIASIVLWFVHIWVMIIIRLVSGFNGDIIRSLVLAQSRGGWSYYYMHGAAPIMQYMAASIQFNPRSQQIIIYVRAKLYICTDVIRNVCSIKNSIT